MIKKALLIFIIISSVYFFDIIFLSNAIKTASQFAAIGLIIFFVAYHFIYDKNIRLSRNFSTEINIIIVSVLLSMFGASLFHGQTFFQTAIAQKAIYFFAFYFLLSYIKIHPDELINLMVIFGIAYALVYIAQFIVFPKQLVSSKILEERGTLRIYMSGGEYSYFAYFFALYKFAKTHKVYYIFLMLLFLSIFIMLGSRQLIATIFGITMIFFLLSKQVKSKFAIGLLGLGVLVSVYFQFQEVFNSMFEVSQNQSAEATENIRLKAAEFYLNEFFPNILSYIIGNGASNPYSEYGSRVIFYMQYFGYFQADIGMIGDYSKYGIFFVLTGLFLIFKIISMRLPAEISFIKYMFAGTLLMSFTGSGFFSEPESIVYLCLTLYVIDAYKILDQKNMLREKIEENHENAAASNEMKPELTLQNY